MGIVRPIRKSNVALNIAQLQSLARKTKTAAAHAIGFIQNSARLYPVLFSVAIFRSLDLSWELLCSSSLMFMFKRFN